jgi:hypothetical protein
MEPPVPSQPAPGPSYPDAPQNPGGPANPPDGQNQSGDDFESHCLALKSLDADCILGLSQSEYSSHVFSAQGPLSSNFKGVWEIRKMLNYQGKQRKLLKGINKDGSKAGPLTLLQRTANLEDWGTQGFSYQVIEAFESDHGIFSVRLRNKSIFDRQEILFECASPRVFKGEKLICRWSQTESFENLSFRGYVEFQRSH